MTLTGLQACAMKISAESAGITKIKLKILESSGAICFGAFLIYMEKVVDYKSCNVTHTNYVKRQSGGMKCQRYLKKNLEQSMI